MLWEVEFHDDFESEFYALSQEVQDELLATAKSVERLGPNADRPHVGTLNSGKHSNMKELRFKANHGAEIWRAAFAFDPERKAVVLVAAAKQGTDEKQFYKDLLRVANARFDKHLQALKRTEAKAEQRQATAGKTQSAGKIPRNK